MHVSISNAYSSTAFHDESVRSNMIMPDVCDTLDILLAPDGADYDLLTPAEKQANNTTRLTYTERDRKILRHYEAMSTPAMQFCKFTQNNTNAWAYILFFAKLTIQDTLAPTTETFADASRFGGQKDVRKRGKKTVLLKTSGTNVLPETERNYSKVETLDPVVELYCKEYAADLSHRLGLNLPNLGRALSWGIILNPMYGDKNTVVSSGLLSAAQWGRAYDRKSTMF